MDLYELNNFITREAERIGKKVFVANTKREQGKKTEADILDAEILTANSLLNRFIVFCRKQDIKI